VLYPCTVIQYYKQYLQIIIVSIRYTYTYIILVGLIVGLGLRIFAEKESEIKYLYYNFAEQHNTIIIIIG